MKKEEYLRCLKDGEIATPAYVLDCTVLEQHVRRIKEIVGDEIGLCYAMKANPYITRIISRWVGKIEVCSPGELAICKRMEIPPKAIVFSGVNKTEEDIREAVEYGADVITIESYKQFRLLRDYCGRKRCSVNIYLRLSNGHQFGLDKDIFEKIIADREAYAYLNICGIHYFSGTQKKSVDANIEELQYLQEYMEYLKEHYDFVPHCLEYGVGLYYPYYTNEDFDTQYDGLTRLTEYARSFHFSGEVVFEMGRFFVASCGDYLTTVQDLKMVEQKKYCLVDGGIHHLNYYGQNMAMRTPVIEKIDGTWRREEILAEYEESFGEDGKWTICGSLCTFADILARNVAFEQMRVGDILVFKNAGAYSLTEAPMLFLSRKMPAVYLYEAGEGVQCIRDIVSSDEYVC